MTVYECNCNSYYKLYEDINKSTSDLNVLHLVWFKVYLNSCHKS